MKLTHALIPTSILGLLLISFACKKNDTTPATDTNTPYVGLTVEKSTTDALMDDVFGEIMVANQTNGLTNQPTSPNAVCYTVGITPTDPTVWPKTVTVDYGTTGCTGLSGYTHKGKIVYTITSKFLTTGATITATFQNFSVNDYKIEGTYSITNNGSANGWNLTDQLNGGKVTYPDGVTWYTKSGTRTWVQTTGAATPTNLLDDEYDITGSGTIASSAGNTLTGTTNTPLHRLATCRNTVSGKLDLLYNNVAAQLDYGAGTCDAVATLTIGSKNYTVTLP